MTTSARGRRSSQRPEREPTLCAQSARPDPDQVTATPGDTPSAGVRRRPWTVHSLGSALAVIGAVLAGVTVLVTAGYLSSGQAPAWAALRVVFGSVCYGAAGLIAWWRRPSNSTGPLLVAATATWLVSAMVYVPGPVLAGIGTMTQLAPFAMLVHLLLAFPAGRLRSWPERTTALGTWAVCLILQAPAYLWTTQSGPAGWLTVAERPDLVRTSSAVQSVIGSVFLASLALILIGRWRRVAPARRRALGVVYGYGLAAAIAIPVLGALAPKADALRDAEVLILAMLPVVLIVAMVRGGFARDGDIQELGAWLGRTPDSAATLTAALAAALGDQSVRLGYRLTDGGPLTSSDGTPIDVESGDTASAAVDVEVHGRAVGAIFYDATLIPDPTTVRAAAEVIALAFDRERLAAALAANHREVERSRLRLVHSIDEERRRIAQNLHDGLQAELVLLAIQAQRLGSSDGPSVDIASAATDLRARIDAAARGLRELVYQVMPPPLIERGLVAAMEDIVDRLPVPTRLLIEVPGELPQPVQSTAYFVIAEALTNAVKHARAHRLSVTVRQEAGMLAIAVEDDGIGGVRLDAGSASVQVGGFGLTGIADRVDSLGGRLTIDSAPGRGTRIAAVIPLRRSVP